MKFMIGVLGMVLLASGLFASSIDFANQGGTLTGSNAGLSLGTSTLVAAGPFVGNLGTISFSTGALISGSLQMGGTFAAGGSFIITSNGSDGIHNGVLFSGTFDGPATWTLVTLANGTHSYTLTDSLTGTWWTGQSVDGATVQLTVNSGKGFFNGSLGLGSGDTDISGKGIKIVTTPEPGTLSLMGGGMLAMAGLLRRRWLFAHGENSL